MSKLSSLPNSLFGSYPPPNLSHGTAIGPAPAPAQVPPEFDFSIKKSPVFGGQGGKDFIQAAKAFEPQAVHFSLSATGLHNVASHSSIQDFAANSKGATHTLQLDQDEYITGISGYADDIFVTDLNVHTSKKVLSGSKQARGQAFKFIVPDDHEVVGFYGRASKQVNAIGVLYARRSKEAKKETPTPSLLPTTTTFEILSGSLQDAWSNGDTDAVVAAKANAHKLLSPIFDNIKSGTKGDFNNFYGMSETDATEWRAVADDAMVSVTTSSTSAGDGYKNYKIHIVWSLREAPNSIAASSGFEWKNVPVQTFTADETAAGKTDESIVGLGFVYFLRPLVDGLDIVEDPWEAALALATALIRSGATKAAESVHKSVKPQKGLNAKGLLGILLLLGVVTFSKDDNHLIVNVYNFDLKHEWGNLGVYRKSDGEEITTGEIFGSSSLYQYTGGVIGFFVYVLPDDSNLQVLLGRNDQLTSFGVQYLPNPSDDVKPFGVYEIKTFGLRPSSPTPLPIVSARGVAVRGFEYGKDGDLHIYEISIRVPALD